MLTADEGFIFTRTGPSLGGVNFGGGQESGGDPEDSEGDPSASIALFCSISMGGENVTTAAFDIATGEIEIEEVTGPVIVTTWTESPH